MQQVDLKEQRKSLIYLDSMMVVKQAQLDSSSWQIIQEENQVTNNTAISLQIMERQKNDYDFRPNINIIVSNKQ